MKRTAAPFVPDNLSDSSITSLAGIVRSLSTDELRAAIQDQLEIFQANDISLENFSDYLDQNLCSDRTRLMDGLALDSYSSPSLKDILKVRLLGLYEIGFHPEYLARYK